MSTQAVNHASQNIFWKFYGSQAFDVIFGAFPVSLLGLYNFLLIIFLIIPSFVDPEFLGFKLLSILSSFLIMLSCASLLTSIFRRQNLNTKTAKYCLVGLWCGIPFALSWMAANVTGAVNQPSQMPLNLGFAFITLSVLVVAVKHIKLLNH